MTETHPPPFAEALLESFGAEQKFRDAILGDLAQEHAQRVDRFGEPAARLWYYRQAALTAPHLLRNWVAGAKLADARRLLNVAALAYAMTAIVVMCVFFGAGAIGSAMDPALTQPIASISVVLLAIGSPILGGYFAASFEESKPMTAAAALAIAWGSIQVFMAVWILLATDVQIDLPAWMRIALIPFFMTVCVLGGAIRVARVRSVA
jgi:hypothetical protein